MDDSETTLYSSGSESLKQESAKRIFRLLQFLVESWLYSFCRSRALIDVTFCMALALMTMQISSNQIVGEKRRYGSDLSHPLSK